MTSLTRRALTTLPDAILGGVAAAVRTLAMWNARSRQRQALKHLDSHILRDIGIDRQSALGEADRPFWKD
jgi:uncharacterized protein YjiS (DUF1127 family)